MSALMQAFRVPSSPRISSAGFLALRGSPGGVSATAKLAKDVGLVDRFQAISLSQLNAKAEMLERRDNKYVVRVPILRQALEALQPQFDVLEIDGCREFTYDTCYFDDVDHTNYFDHHRGRRKRCKVRIRKYVDADLCFVEIKLKDKRDQTIKKRLAYAPEKYGSLDSNALQHVHAAYRALYRQPFSQQLVPVLEMRYRRITLVAKQGQERMTIDRALVFKGMDGEFAIADDICIVETKSGNANGIADKLLRGLHQHPTKRCSKYCTAVAALRKVRKHNRFLTALRKLAVLPPSSAHVRMAHSKSSFHRQEDLPCTSC